MDTFRANFLFLFIGTLLALNYASETFLSNYEAVSTLEEDNYRLPLAIEPLRYNILLDPALPVGPIKKDEENKYFNFKGITNIDVTVKIATDTIILHQGQISINYFTVVGENIFDTKSEYNKTTEQLKIIINRTLNVGENITLNFEYNGVIRDDMIGFYRSSYIDSQGKLKWLVSTQFQTTHARHAFPCFDEPHFKAIFSIRVQRDKSYKCLSNMPLVSSKEIKDTTRYWDEFKESVKMSTYLVAFVISNFETINSNSNVKVWARPEAVDQTEYAASIASAAIAFFHTTFKQEYQIPKMDMVAVPDFSAGAMENWGLITYRETRVLYDEVDSSIISKQTVASVIVHEITHMWFGNLVTPAWWGYLWLSEAFARYYQYMATAKIETTWNMDEQFVVEQLHAAFAVDGIESSKPMTRNPNNLAEISTMGDSITYAKGASIVRMMNFIFGEKNFLDALQNYLRIKSYNVATPEDLWQILQTIVDKNDIKLNATVKTIMNTWTQQAGFPVVNVFIDKNGKATFKQERFLLRNLKDTLINTTWWIPLTWTTSKESNFETVNVKLWLDKEETSAEVDIKPEEWIIFNIQQSGFYRVNYDTKLWYRIFDVLKSERLVQIHELNRAAIVDDLLNLARAGQLGYAIAIDGLQYLEHEINYLPIKAAINGLQYLNRRFSGQAREPLYKDFVLSIFANAYNKVGYVDKKSDSQETLLLRHDLNVLACKFDHIGCVENALKRFGDWKNFSKEIEVNQRPSIYCTAIRYGNAEDWEFLWKKAFNSNVAADQLVILNALGCTQDITLLKKYFNYALLSYEESRIHKQDSTSVFAAAYSSSLIGANYVLDYIDAYHDEIAKHGGYSEVSTILSGASQYFSTQKLVDKFEDLIKKHEKEFTSILPSLNSALSLTKYELEWYKNNEKDIALWLKRYSEKKKTSYRLTSDIVPIKYTISITPFLDLGDFHGIVEIDAEVTESTNEIVLHSQKLTHEVIEVYINDKMQDITTFTISKYDFLVIKLGKTIPFGIKLKIKIIYSGTLLHKDMRGFYRSSYQDDNNEVKYLAATHLEPVGARKVFPCFDEPVFKATFVIKINALENQNVISNMPVTSVNEDLNGRKWITFAETPMMSTYLVAFVISDFKCSSDKSGKYSVCARPEAIDETTYALSVMELLVKFYENQLAFNYQLPKLNMIALPDFSSGAMENWGLLTYKETNLLYNPDKSAISVKQSVANVISHEISHQWFGNLVTPEWWEYLWLNEGFARYFQYFGTKNVEKKWSLEMQFIVDQLHSAFNADASSSSHPMNKDVNTPSEIRAMFSTISYAKAASVIRMIEKTYGEEIFYKALQNYLKTRQYQVATPNDLSAEFINLITDPTAKSSFQSFINSWASQAGYPVVHAKFEKDYSSVSLVQERFLLKPNEKPTETKALWHVPITWASNGKPDFGTTSPDCWLVQESGKCSLDKFLTQEWVILNVQQSGYYRVNYEPEHWERIINLLLSDAFETVHEANRASLIDDLLNLARAGYVDYNIVLSATQYLTQETDYIPWRAFFNGLSYLHKRFAGREIYDLYNTHVTTLLKPIYKKLNPANSFEDRNTESHTTLLLKRNIFEWACKLKNNTNCVDTALKYYDNWRSDGKTIPTNYRYVVFCMAAKYNEFFHLEELWQTYLNSTTIDDKLVILKSIACTENRRYLSRLLNTAITAEPQEIRYQYSTEIFSSVYDSSLVGLELTMDFINTYYDEMLVYYEDDSKFKSIINGVSQRLSTPELINKFKEMINKISEKYPKFEKSFDSYLQKAYYELNWYNTYAPRIYEWLQTAYPPVVHRLPSNVLPLDYTIHIKATEIALKDTFDGLVKINVNILQNTSYIVLNAVALEIENAQVLIYEDEYKTKPLTILSYVLNEKSEQLTIYLKNVLSYGDKIIITIKYRGKLTESYKGFYRTSYKDAEGKLHWIALTQFAPTHARRAFPCFDEPALKAKFNIVIERPNDYNSHSNMPRSVEHVSDVTTADVFISSERMSTYTVAFIISDFEFISNGIVNVGGRSEMLPYAQSAAKHGKRVLKFLEDFTLIPYVLPKLDLVGVPEFSYGAMENWGLSVFKEVGLFADEEDTSAYYKQYRSIIISHELAHMWFGNLVTLKWWDYTWLNEGFAEYFQWIISDELEPKEWHLLDQFVVDELQVAMVSDSSKDIHSMTRPVSTSTEIARVFDSITYSKAASIIRMFHNAFGHEVFLKAIQNYLNTHQYKNTSPSDIFKEFEKTVIENAAVGEWDVPIDILMLSWTNQPGYPVVIAELHDEILVLKQKRYMYWDRPVEDYTYWIPITLATESSPNFNLEPTKYWLGYEPLLMALNTTDTWFILNVQQAGYYRVNYNSYIWNNLIKVLRSNNYDIIHPINRAQIIDDTLTFARTNDISLDIAFNATTYLIKENNYLPWRAFFNAITFFSKRLDNKKTRSVFADYIVTLTSNAFEKLQFNNISSESHMNQLKGEYILKWACKYGNLLCITKALNLFSAWRKDSAIWIDPNAKPAVYCTAVEFGPYQDWEYLWEQYKKAKFASEQETILNALGCVRNSTLIEFYLEEALKSEVISKQYINTVFKSVYDAHSYGLETSLKFVSVNYEKIYKATGTWDTVAHIMSNIAERVSSKEQLEQYQAFVDNHKANLPEIKSSLESSLRYAWLNQQWFNTYSSQLTPLLNDTNNIIKNSIQEENAPGHAGNLRSFNIIYLLAICLIFYIL